MTNVLVLMALQPSFFNSFSQTWVHLWFALLTMGSTMAKCRSHRDKGLLCVYPRKEKIFFLNEKLETHHSAEYCVQN